jgi:hypothetical protein
MDMEEPGYFPDRQHVAHSFIAFHIFIFSHLLFN